MGCEKGAREHRDDLTSQKHKQRTVCSGFIVTTMSPTVAANLIGYTTNFIMEDVYEAALGVNLTIMLVITTM